MADQVNWLEMGSVENPNGSKKKVAAQGKSPRDKMFANFDQQLSLFNAGKVPDTRMGRAKAWFKEDGGVVEIVVRYAGAALPMFPNKSTSFYVPKKNFKAVAKAIRADLEAGAFDDVIAPLDAALTARIDQRKATREAKKTAA